MADDADERFERHESILKSLTTMVVKMDVYLAQQAATNTRLEESIRQQGEFNRQQVEINTDTKITLARVETLLARMLRHEDNGREA